MATIPTVPSEKDTTKVSLSQAIIDTLSELNAEVAGGLGRLKNGSFEDVDAGEPTLWDVTDSSGGSHQISDATDSGGEAHHGQRSLQMTTTGGGGFVEALSSEFLPVGNGNTILCAGFARRDTAAIRTRIQLLYYNESQSLVATDTIYDNSGTGTSYALVGASSDAPATAHFYKVKLIGGESGGAIAGNVFFDGFASAALLRPPTMLPTSYGTAGATTYTVPDGVFAVHLTCAGAGGGGGSNDTGAGGGGGSGFIEGHTVEVAPGDVLVVTVGALGAGGAGGGNDGADGGDSWVAPPASNFANRYIAGAGGGGGKDGTTGTGGSGWNDGSAESSGTGGNGADHVYGTGGTGGAPGVLGGDASGNCAGGGGAGSGTGAPGGDGADGFIIITPHLI